MSDLKIYEEMTIGVVGAGFVGKATSLFKGSSINSLVYDLEKEKCSPEVSQLSDLKECDLVFICLPTPMNEDGACHTKIIEDCILDLEKAGIDKEDIIVRSTVPVGFCELNQVHHMPEFLTERNWKNDFKECELRLLGIASFKQYGVSVLNHPTINKVRNLLELAKKDGAIESKEIEFCTCDLAETTKHVRNCFLAVKISFFNEVAAFCKANEITYSSLEKLVKYDNRIGNTHTSVPGKDGHRGFGGTCFPKDISSFIKQFEAKNVECLIMKAAQERNDNIDRPEKDWKNDKGRAVI